MPIVRPAQGADDDPVAVHHAGGPRPPPGQPDAAVYGHATARGRQGSGRQERPRREGLFLGLLAEQRHHPVVQGVEAQGPCTGRASVRHPADRIQNRGPRRLNAAVARGDEQFGELRCDEVVDGGAGQPAQFLGLLRALCQLFDELGADVRRGRRPSGHSGERTILLGMEALGQRASMRSRKRSRRATPRAFGDGPDRCRNPIPAANVALARRSASSPSNP